MKTPKPPEVRRREAEMIRVQLEGLGFPESALESPNKVLEEFVTKGYGSTTTHRLPDLGVAIMLQLSMQPHVMSFARLRKIK